MLTFNDKILLFNDKWLQRDKFTVTTYGQFGTVTALPNQGYAGEVVTLSNTPNAGYVFDHYAITGATLSGNTFKFYDSDVAVSGIFAPVTHTITYSTVVNGSFSGPATAAVGSTVVITASPNTGFTLDYITVNGTQIQGNTFTMPDSNVTVGGHFTMSYTGDDLLVLKFASSFDPRSNFGAFTGTWTNLGNNTWKFEGRFVSLSYESNSPNFEVLYGVQNNDAQNLFLECTKLTKVNDYTINGSADTTNPYNAISVFEGCTNLTEANVTLNNVKSASMMFDMWTNGNSYDDADNPTALTKVTIKQTGYTLKDSGWMFAMCHELEYAPYVQCDTVMDYSWYMYWHCHKVEGGALDMYNQLKNYTYQSSYDYVDCFRECGRDTVTGAAELAQIPSSWGGTGA